MRAMQSVPWEGLCKSTVKISISVAKRVLLLFIQLHTRGINNDIFCILCKCSKNPHILKPVTALYADLLGPPSVPFCPSAMSLAS